MKMGKDTAGGLLKLLTAAGVIAFGTGTATFAADYPTRQPHIIVSYPAGGSTDISARLIGKCLGDKLKTTFVIENRPGGGNNIGTDAALKATPDGYTLFLANPANTINATLYKHLPFDFLKDSTPVAGIMKIPNVMEVHPSVPAKTVKEFIEYAKANPGKINMASSGNGTSIHLSGMLFMGMTGIKMQHIPYKGSAPALNDMLSGQVQVMFDNLPSSIGHIQAGKLRALAVTTAQRAPELPDVPTVAETVPGYEASAFFGISAPKGTPKEIVDTLNKTTNACLQDKQTVEAIRKLGGAPFSATPDEFGQFLTAETAKWRKVVLDAKLSID